MAAFDEEVKPLREDFLDPVTADMNTRRTKPRRTINAVAGGVAALVALALVGVIAKAIVKGGSATTGQVAEWIAIAIFTAPIYLAPSLVASSRNHRNAAAIIALNVLLGWTFIGWAVALVWALMREKQILQR